MESVHQIRLKGPWDVLAPNADHQNFERQSMPQSWRALFGDSAGEATFRRGFNRPTGLGAKDQVLIIIPKNAGEVSEFQINQTIIAPTSRDGSEFEITAQLEGFNQLQLRLKFDPQATPELPGGLWDTVTLEIRSH